MHLANADSDTVSIYQVPLVQLVTDRKDFLLFIGICYFVIHRNFCIKFHTLAH